MMKWLGVLGCLAAALTPGDAHAGKFQNQFVSFELPRGWDCQLEGAEWVCQGGVGEERRRAIIIFAAKYRGESDSLDKFLEHLKTPRTYEDRLGLVKSKVQFARARKINGHLWIDALHDDSELRGFRTRYCATVHADISILITYSVRRESYAEMAPAFDDLLSSLHATRERPGTTGTKAR